MVAVARAQFTWHRELGVPADDITNTWYFKNSSEGSVDPGDANTIADAVRAFYDEGFTWFSQVLGASSTVKVYDMNDAEPRVPVFEETAAINNPTGTSLPGELASCVSFSADPESGVNQARRRGRVYLGPLATATMGGADSAGDIRVVVGFSNAMKANFVSEIVTPLAGIGYAHCVYSPTTDATSSLDAATALATTYYMDNAFDVQRRRGAKASVRFSWA